LEENKEKKKRERINKEGKKWGKKQKKSGRIMLSWHRAGEPAGEFAKIASLSLFLSLPLSFNSRLKLDYAR